MKFPKIEKLPYFLTFWMSTKTVLTNIANIRLQCSYEVVKQSTVQTNQMNHVCNLIKPANENLVSYWMHSYFETDY